MRKRAGWISALVLISAIIVSSIVAMLLGDYPMTPAKAVQALFGVSGDPLAEFFVQELRLPRVLSALLIGAALGVSGNIFQQLSGNPLGSPDIIGFSAGAASGAVISIIVLGASPAGVSVGAIVGGAISATIVYFLSIERGKVNPTRLIMVGIGMGATVQAMNGLLIVLAELTAAQGAAQWLAGSLNASTWAQTVILLGAAVILIPAVAALTRPLDIMRTGDDAATAQGVHVIRRRRELIIVGVTLTALAVAMAGPIAFVALAAPQLARRIAPGVAMPHTALMGALIVLTSDIVAQRIFAPTQIPVGVVTGVAGGIYLIALLVRQWKKV